MAAAKARHSEFPAVRSIQLPASSCGVSCSALASQPQPGTSLAAPARAECGQGTRAHIYGCLCTGVPTSQPRLPPSCAVVRLHPPPLRAQASGRLGSQKAAPAPSSTGVTPAEIVHSDSVLVSASRRTQPGWGLRFHLHPLHQARPLSLLQPRWPSTWKCYRQKSAFLCLPG